MAFMQGVNDPIHDFIVKAESFEQISKAFFECFFASVRLWTFPLVAGAMIVDVLTFLPLCNKSASAMPTIYEP